MRNLCDIAKDLIATGKVGYAAKPYVEAMLELNDTSDEYWYDSGREIVLYALGNLSHMRHPNARRLRAELKQHVDQVLTKKEKEALEIPHD